MTGDSRDNEFLDLQRDVRDMLRRTYPNPERVGCLDQSTLEAIARGELPPDHPGHAHVMECSPCYEESYAMRQHFLAGQARARATRWRTVGIGALAVAAAALVAAILLTGRQQRPAPTSPPKPEIAANRPPSPPPVEAPLPTSVVNLQVASPTRGGSDQKAPGGPQRLARRKQNLRLYLPVGMDEGTYEVRLRQEGAQAVALELSGTARMEDGLAVLRFQPDLSTLAAGRYELEFRRRAGQWLSMLVLVE